MKNKQVEMGSCYDGFCVLGAMTFHLLHEEKDANEKRGNTLTEAFKKANNIQHIQEWNDDFDRSKDDVLAALDKAVLCIK